jgi:Lrp/AsnC family transcriptional regulator for asnA, asnC and gidA
MTCTVKVDEVDARILKILLAESRTSFTEIADECKITVAAVRMRYKHLWDEGIINGEKMLVNPHCLGFRHIVDLGIECSVKDEKEVIKFLDNKPYISEVIGPLGKYNFYGKVALRDLNKLREIIENLEANCNIKNVDALIWVKAVNIEFPQNLIIRPLDRENELTKIFPIVTQDQVSLEIDDADKKIAKILSENSRTPFDKIAKELDLSPKTVMHRYKKLRLNLLPLSTITVDLTKLGYNALGNLYIKVSNQSMTELCSQLLQIPNLIVMIEIIGRYDLYCAIILEDFSHGFEVMKKIRQIKGIEKMDTFLTKTPPSWPFNLFPSLLDNENMQPKYWL